MGTVFSIDIPATASGRLPDVLRWLHWVDATFSPYREDSEVSRFGRGELTLTQQSLDGYEAFGISADGARWQTGGFHHHAA